MRQGGARPQLTNSLIRMPGEVASRWSLSNAPTPGALLPPAPCPRPTLPRLFPIRPRGKRLGRKSRPHSTSCPCCVCNVPASNGWLAAFCSCRRNCSAKRRTCACPGPSLLSCPPDLSRLGCDTNVAAAVRLAGTGTGTGTGRAHRTISQLRCAALRCAVLCCAVLCCCFRLACPPRASQQALQALLLPRSAWHVRLVWTPTFYYGRLGCRVSRFDHGSSSKLIRARRTDSGKSLLRSPRRTGPGARGRGIVSRHSHDRSSRLLGRRGKRPAGWGQGRLEWTMALRLSRDSPIPRIPTKSFRHRLPPFPCVYHQGRPGTYPFSIPPARNSPSPLQFSICMSAANRQRLLHLPSAQGGKRTGWRARTTSESYHHPGD